ncbi:MAG: restriction endonuclease subunit S [Verrucomicrobiales bacterium]|nr:restriction endonuclease subunit S [Verrucomicrobiales bacterium]
MPDKLPKGWVKTTLGEVNVPTRARALPSEAPDLPYVGMEHVQSQTMKLLGQGDASSLKSSSVRFSKGDVLYGKMRPYLNKVWLAEFDGLCSAEFLVFPKTEGLNSQLFAYRLNSQDFVNFANHQVSGDRPRVDFEKLAKFPYLLAPSREQERIVAKLDALLSRVAAGEAAARRALDRLQRYRATVLHAAVTGELTRAWRKTHKPEETGAQLLKRLLTERRAHWETAEFKRLHAAGKPPRDDKWKDRYREPSELGATDLPSLPRGWAWASLQQLGFIIGGLTKNPRRASLRTKLPYLRVGNVYANELRLDEVKTIGVEKDELGKLLVEKGDLLIVEGNGSKDQIGRLAIWDDSIVKCVHQNHIIKVRLVEEALGTWILSWLLSPPGRHHVEKVASSTTGLYTLSVGKVGNLPIPLPPSTEQAEVGRQVERRLAAADRLAATLNRQLERAQVTRQSLLREAFAGNLVPQNPNDEAASILLERIRAAGAPAYSKPRSSRGHEARTSGNRASSRRRLRTGAVPA